MSLLPVAINLAERGFPVLPVAITRVSGATGHGAWRKAPLNTSATKGEGGSRGASTVPEIIRAWWARLPAAQVGIACGHPLDGGGFLFVVDDDGALADAEAQCGPLPESVRVETPSGGQHVYLRSKTPLPNGKGTLRAAAVDVRGLGGFVVAPPSIRPDGAIWTGRIDVDRIAWLPDTWVAVLAAPASPPREYTPPALTDSTDTERRYASQALVGACSDIAGASAGGRHALIVDKATKLGGYVAAGLIDEALVVAELQRAGEAAGKAAKEVARTVRECVANGKARPYRPEVRQVSATMGKDEAMAWWVAHPEASSTEAAQVLGIKAETLRAWQAERRAMMPPVMTMTMTASAGNIPRNQADIPPSSSPVQHEELPCGMTESGPLDILAEAGAKVRAGADKATKAAPLYDLLGDRLWIEAMVAARMADPTAGVAELGRLGDAFHGARALVNQMEEAIKQRRRAVVEAAKQAARALPPPGSPPPAGAEDDQDELPEIVITTNMPGVINDAIRALDKAGDLPLYQRGGMLVHLTRDASPRGLTWDPEAPVLRPVRAPRLREMMSASARWKKTKQTPQGWEYEAALPATWAVDGVLAREQWPFRRAQGITEIPILRADGTIHEVPGYDAVSGYIHEPPDGFRLRWPHADFDQELAAAAYERLCMPFLDFPFADPWHMAAAVGLLLSLVARPAIDGPVPLFPVLSTTPKSGKTLMVEMIHLIATGREIARAQPGETDEELEKRITVIALGGFPAVLWDNLTSALGGPALDAAVQGRMWQGRILGRSEPVTVPMRTVFVATGNNLAIKGDLAQRVMPIQLEPEVERPELRTDFRIPGGEAGLRAYVKEHRADLLAAAFSLLRAHAKAGRPRAGTFGGYAEWNAIVRSALVWAGAADPYQGVAQLADVADERQGQIKGLLAAWYEAYASESIYVSDLAEHHAASRHPNFFAAVKAIAATRDGHPDFSRLAWLLRTIAGRIYGGFRLLRSEQLRHGARSWKVTCTSAGPSTPKPEQLDIPY